MSLEPSLRETALRMLIRVEESGAYPRSLLESHFKRSRGMEERDRAFLRETLIGTVRHRRKLDYAADRFSTTPLRKLDAPTRNALRLGAYQLLFMDRIRPSAAVNETVQAVKQVHPRSSGVVNAILRKLARQPESLAWPDPEAEPIESAGVMTAHPEPLVQAAVEAWGWDGAQRWLAFNNQNAPLCLRTNTLKIGVDKLFETLESAGGQPEKSRHAPEGIYLRNPSAANLDFQSGLFYAQDEAAQQVARLTRVGSGAEVLEVGAAPGGKTGHLAAMMENRGRLIAVDRHRGRLQRMKSNLAALGVANVSYFARDFSGDLGFLEGRRFDAVLIDAPCSGWGTLRRHPEKKWADLAGRESITKIQLGMLDSSAELLAPGGRIVYSTCTVFAEENEGVVDRFLESQPGWERVSAANAGIEPGWVDEKGDMKSYLPLIGGEEETVEWDGFYAATLQRTGET